jgi:hypothetical protein
MRKILVLICAFFMLAPAMMGQSKAKAKPMDDAALDKITAGGDDGGGDKGGNGSIQLSGNALQGEQSLIQINAVNSTVTVLVNLTVIMNSTVGTVTQGNNPK